MNSIQPFDCYGEAIGNGRYLVRDNVNFSNTSAFKFYIQHGRVILSYLPSILKTSLPQSTLLVNKIFEGKPKAIAIIKSTYGYLLNIAIPIFYEDIITLQKQQMELYLNQAFKSALNYNAKQVTLTGILPHYYFNDTLLQSAYPFHISSGYATRSATIFANIIGALNTKCIREINTIAIIGCQPFGTTILYMLISYGIIIHNILLYNDIPQTIKERLHPDFSFENVTVNNMSNFIKIREANLIVSSVELSAFLTAQDIRAGSLFFNYSEQLPFPNEDYIQLLENNVCFYNAGVLASNDSVEQLFLMPNIPDLSNILRYYGLGQNSIAGCSIAGSMPPSTTFDCYELSIEATAIYKKLQNSGFSHSSNGI